LTGEATYERLLDEKERPTEKEIEKYIGAATLPIWKELRGFLTENYDFTPELVYYGQKYGWCFRYRRKGKTLCVLYPEKGAFTALVTLGKLEIQEVRRNFSKFHTDTQKMFTNAHQYHDGKWIYKRILSQKDVEDVRQLISIKKKPKELIANVS
jgi:hypothetical protein